MALSIAAAPLAVAWCQSTCAETAAAAAPHSRHHHASPASGTRLAPVALAVHLTGMPHACGHDDEVPASQTALDTFASPATLTQLLEPWQPVATARPAPILSSALVPIPPLLQTPLRV